MNENVITSVRVLHHGLFKIKLNKQYNILIKNDSAVCYTYFYSSERLVLLLPPPRKQSRRKRRPPFTFNFFSKQKTRVCRVLKRITAVVYRAIFRIVNNSSRGKLRGFRSRKIDAQKTLPRSPRPSLPEPGTGGKNKPTVDGRLGEKKIKRREPLTRAIDNRRRYKLRRKRVD